MWPYGFGYMWTWPEHLPMQLLMNDTRNTALIPTHNTKIFIVWTFPYYLTTYAALHVALLVVLVVDTLHSPRWNNYVILVSRHVLFYSSASSMFPWLNNLVTCPARRWRTPWCMRGPRVYLSIVGVAIPTTASCNTMDYYPVRAKIIFIVTLSWT